MNQPIISTDPFSKSLSIDWMCVDGRESDYHFGFKDGIATGASNENLSKFIFSPIHRNNNHYLKIRLQNKFFDPKKGDSISFLFSDEHIEVFEIESNPGKISDDYNWGIIKETVVPISLQQLTVFATKKFVSWKYISKGGHITFDRAISGNGPVDLVVLQRRIQSLFSDFIAILQKQGLFSNQSQENNADPAKCFVYCMRDTSNNAVKIGISNNPDYRERTLQSEKPSIEIIFHKKYSNRGAARIVEKILHDYFSNKRVRGEWFHLTPDDLGIVQEVLNR